MIQYQLLGGMQNGMSISTLVQSAQTNGGGPTPVLTPGGAAVNLGQGHHQTINFGAAPQKVLAFGLLTCAGVVLASTDPNAAAQAVVYHATSGHLPGGILATLRAAIGNPPIGSLLAVYVTPKPWDHNYNADAMKIQTYGVPANCVIYIDNFPASQFGINSHGQVGF